MGLGTLLPGSLVASGIYNLDSTRCNAAPRDTRNEGWTEAWGGIDQKDLPNSHHFDLDDESIALLLATPHPQLPLILTQFRPAWVEQIVLRLANVPHIVLNSNHVTNEATGALPFLRDHQHPTQPPILVGRHHPSNIASSNPAAQNHIVEYLKTAKNIDLDHELLTTEQKSMSKCYMNLIQNELQPILLYLRYEDSDAWEQVYRRQYLMATSPQSNTWVSHLHGRFQACLERVTIRRRLVEISRTLTLSRALERAKEAYTALEQQLLRIPNNIFLMGVPDKPTLVDAVLWAHLAEALGDVHLVVLLADFPRLVQYFQNIHKKYFQDDGDTWDQWNQAQNKANAFQQLPFQNDKKKLSVSTFKDAIDLMQSLSLQKHDLQEVLDTTKAKIASEPWPTPTPSTETLFYRWRMGEDFSKKSEENATDPQENPIRKKLIRDQIRNDQVWISGVAGVSFLAILLLQGNTKSEK